MRHCAIRWQQIGAAALLAQYSCTSWRVRRLLEDTVLPKSLQWHEALRNAYLLWGYHSDPARFLRSASQPWFWGKGKSRLASAFMVSPASVAWRWRARMNWST